jgi:hypothetical protein
MGSCFRQLFPALVSMGKLESLQSLLMACDGCKTGAGSNATNAFSVLKNTGKNTAWER